MPGREQTIEALAGDIGVAVEHYRDTIVEARDKYHRIKDMEPGEEQAESWDQLRELEQRERTALDAILFTLVKLTNEVKRSAP